MKKKLKNADSPLSFTAEKITAGNKPAVSCQIAVNDDEMEEIKAMPVNDQKTATGLLILLYPDTKDYNFGHVLGILKQRCEKQGHTYAWVTHDRDYYKENTYDSNYKLIGKKGTKKKLHIHFLVLFKDSKPVNISEFLPEELPVKFVRIVKHKDNENYTLYLSHIAHPEKTYYPYQLIQSNNPDWVNGVHENYRPYSVVDYVQRYLDNTDVYITYTKMFRLIQDEIPGNYGYYKQNYAIIRDMINDHNRNVEKNVSVQQEVEHATTQLKLKGYTDMQKITNLVNDFGITSFEFNGKTYDITLKNKPS